MDLLNEEVQLCNLLLLDDSVGIGMFCYDGFQRLANDHSKKIIEEKKEIGTILDKGKKLAEMKMLIKHFE